MVSDIPKLNSIISSLEDQAKRVTEFSGLLSAVNEARTQIETSKDLLKTTHGEQKQIFGDFRNYFNELEKRLNDIEKDLDKIVGAQIRIIDEISSLDILSPQQFQEGLKTNANVTFEHLDKLEQRVEALGISQQKGLTKFSLMLFFATAVIFGAVVYFNLT